MSLGDFPLEFKSGSWGGRGAPHLCLGHTLFQGCLLWKLIVLRIKGKKKCEKEKTLSKTFYW